MKKAIMMIIGVLAMLAPQLKKEDSTEGVKETTEAIIAGNEIGVFCCEKFADGFQVDDFSEFYKKLTEDKVFMDKIKAGYENASKIKAEFKDIDTGEGLQLAQVQLEYLPKYLDAFAKPEPTQETV